MSRENRINVLILALTRGVDFLAEEPFPAELSESFSQRQEAHDAGEPVGIGEIPTTVQAWFPLDIYGVPDSTARSPSP